MCYYNINVLVVFVLFLRAFGVFCFQIPLLIVFGKFLQTMRELMRLDEQELNNRIKVGVLYCKAGQTNEEEWYNNGELTTGFYSN